VRKINTKDYTGAADEFLRWDKANLQGALVQMPGLSRRRAAERQLFLQ
jgi:GH24 family phage-related lysozyme (muramidase)